MTMSGKIPIGFFGYGTRALDALMHHPAFDVKYNWAPEKRLCSDVYEAAERYKEKISLQIIKDRNDLLAQLKKVNDVRCFLMNASPIILTKPILEVMDFYNIHPGSLVDNRGHHPHLWSILLDESETQINLHSVTPEIDLGNLISSITLPVRKEDTSFTLLNRMEDHIGELLTDLAQYLSGQRMELGCIEAGTYRRKMVYEDYQINPKTDTLSDMDRKIRTRAMHSGAFFVQEGRRYYVNQILDYSKRSSILSTFQIDEKKHIPYSLSEETGTLVLCRRKEMIRFQESKITSLEGTILCDYRVGVHEK